MTEVLGGWFVFGAADRIRYTMEKVFGRMHPPMPADITAGSDASATLSEILLAGPPKLEYLVAHGKGSLVASHALQHYVKDLGSDESGLFDRLRITTLGAVIEFPPAFKKVKQYLGALDWFGGANSSPCVTHERVPQAGHHLNRRFPYHMSVAALLNGGAAPRLLPKPSMAKTLAPLSVAPAAAEQMTSVKPKAAPKPVKKLAKPPSPAPKAASATPRAASAASRVPTPAAKVNAASKAASSAPKAVPTPKPPVEAVRQPSIAAKQVTKPAPKKIVAAPRKPLQSAKPKIAAVNGKLVVKKSKKEAR